MGQVQRERSAYEAGFVLLMAFDRRQIADGGTDCASTGGPGSIPRSSPRQCGEAVRRCGEAVR